MRRFYFLHFLVFLTQPMLAQRTPNTRPGIRPVIYLSTISGNSLTGLCLGANDSVIFIYPGTRREWQNRMSYKTVPYPYAAIQTISLKHQKQVSKAMILGGTLGFATAAGASIFSKPGFNAKSLRLSLSLLSLGIASGATWGACHVRKYSVRGKSFPVHKYKFPL